MSADTSDSVGGQVPVPAQPGARAAAASWMDHNGHLWLFGGRGFDERPSRDPHCLQDLWLFNASSEVWSLVVSPAKPSGPSDGKKARRRHLPKARHSACLCGLDDIFLVLHGGEDTTGKKLADTWVFYIEQRSWLPVLKPHNHTDHPVGRMGAAHWCLQNKLIVYGGVDQYGRNLDDMWQFSLRTLQWEKMRQESSVDQVTVNGDPFPAARHGAATWWDRPGYLYLYGGSTDPSSTSMKLHHSAGFRKDVWRYHTHSNTWGLLKTEPQNSEGQPGARQYSMAVSTGSDCYLMYGGEGQDGRSAKSTFFSDLWTFNVTNNTWIFVDNNKDYVNQSTYFEHSYVVLKHVPVTSRSQATMWFHKNLTYLFGGFGRDGRGHTAFLNDQWVMVRGDTAAYLAHRLERQQKDTVWTRTFSPAKIFFIVFTLFGSIVLLVGAVCFFRKMCGHPQHGAVSEFKVKYTRLKTEEPALPM